MCRELWHVSCFALRTCLRKIRFSPQNTPAYTHINPKCSTKHKYNIFVLLLCCCFVRAVVMLGCFGQKCVVMYTPASTRAAPQS